MLINFSDLVYAGNILALLFSFLKKKYFKNKTRVSSSLHKDQGLIWIQIVCKNQIKNNYTARSKQLKSKMNYFLDFLLNKVCLYIYSWLFQKKKYMHMKSKVSITLILGNLYVFYSNTNSSCCDTILSCLYALYYLKHVLKWSVMCI